MTLSIRFRVAAGTVLLLASLVKGAGVVIVPEPLQVDSVLRGMCRHLDRADDAHQAYLLSGSAVHLAAYERAAMEVRKDADAFQFAHVGGRDGDLLRRGAAAALKCLLTLDREVRLRRTAA